jgi:hypothetical protein
MFSLVELVDWIAENMIRQALLGGVQRACLTGWLAVLTLPVAVAAVDSEAPDSEYRRSVAPTRLLWGDLHLHSNLSADAFVLENRTLGPDAAFRFARGETITSTSGTPARLKQPLDFLAVTDHAEYLGIFAAISPVKNDTPESPSLREAVLESAIGRRWASYMEADEFAKARAEFVQNSSSDPSEEDRLPKMTRSMLWNHALGVAESFNNPGVFTTLLGYEWTSMVDGNNLHRVVLFEDGKEKAGQITPFSAMRSRDPVDLWAALESYEKLTGGRAIAIPHNSNMSNGRMFPEVDAQAQALPERYIKGSSRWEPLMEVTQVKGDVETHPAISPDDPFAAFETWDAGNILQTEEKTEAMLKYEYARSVLAVGMSLEDEFGTNPYQFGFVGSTDSHTALSTADADNYFGKFPNSEPALGRAEGLMGGKWLNATLSSAGYVAVWAPENSRKAIFSALKRREVYASTGPRISVRFFGGWAYQQADISRSDFAENAYELGVPMGGTLGAYRSGVSPKFLVAAAKDPLGANLDRIQIIKVWNDTDGQYRESIVDVMTADQAEINLSQNFTDDTSPLKMAEESAGRAALSGYWEDPDFDPALRASYYARVLEVATPRWTTHDVRKFGGESPDDVPEFIQQRAYTSPIWYRPESSQLTQANR